MIAGCGARLVVYHARTGAHLLNEPIFSGTRVHGITPYATAPLTLVSKVPATAQLLALHGGRHLSLMHIQYGRPHQDCAPFGDTSPSTQPPGFRSTPTCTPVSGCSLTVHIALQPNRHWILAVALMPAGPSRARASTAAPDDSHGRPGPLGARPNVGFAAESSTACHADCRQDEGVLAAVGFIDNSIELWTFHAPQRPAATTSESVPGASQWQAARLQRVENSVRLLLYCMDLAAATGREAGDPSVHVHVASGALLCVARCDEHLQIMCS
jgi:hypothetical protein